MIVIPAVDLRDGRCVRLREGRADTETVFSADPVAMAVRWAALGAERLHVVDLDGAFAGIPRQTPLIAKIAAAVAPVPIQAGGGVREVAAIEALREAGARWVVVGTRAALDPRFLAEIGRHFGEHVIVAVDARDDRVLVRGWTAPSDLGVLELAVRARDAGAAAVLFTDVSRDGTEHGPNVAATAALARSARVPVLASGGVGRVADVAALAGVADAGIAGVVIGRALYTGALTLADARAAARPR